MCFVGRQANTLERYYSCLLFAHFGVVQVEHGELSSSTWDDTSQDSAAFSEVAILSDWMLTMSFVLCRIAKQLFGIADKISQNKSYNFCFYCKKVESLPFQHWSSGQRVKRSKSEFRCGYKNPKLALSERIKSSRYDKYESVHLFLLQIIIVEGSASALCPSSQRITENNSWKEVA